MAGIGFASVDTDVSSLVNAAFDEVECCIPTGGWFGEHGGSKVALVDNHGCDGGYVCAEHLTRHISARIARLARDDPRLRGHPLCTVQPVVFQR